MSNEMINGWVRLDWIHQNTERERKSAQNEILNSLCGIDNGSDTVWVRWVNCVRGVDQRWLTGRHRQTEGERMPVPVRQFVDDDVVINSHFKWKYYVLSTATAFRQLHCNEFQKNATRLMGIVYNHLFLLHFVCDSFQLLFLFGHRIFVAWNKFESKKKRVFCLFRLCPSPDNFLKRKFILGRPTQWSMNRNTKTNRKDFQFLSILRRDLFRSLSLLLVLPSSSID